MDNFNKATVPSKSMDNFNKATVPSKSMDNFKGVMTRLMVDALSELCFPFLKEGNSACIAVTGSGLFPQTGYRSPE